MKEYEPNIEMKSDIQRGRLKRYYKDKTIAKNLSGKQYKIHPLWKRRKVARIMLGILPYAFGFFMLITSSKDDVLVALILNFMVPIILGYIPYIVYYKMLQNTCNDIVKDRSLETVTIDEEYLTYKYHPVRISDDNIIDEMQIKYEDIIEIIYNEYHERLDIYGRVRNRRYTNYKKRKYNLNKFNNKPGTRIRLYLYYNDNEDLLYHLETVTKTHIKYIDKPEE